MYFESLIYILPNSNQISLESTHRGFGIQTSATSGLPPEAPAVTVLWLISERKEYKSQISRCFFFSDFPSKTIIQNLISSCVWRLPARPAVSVHYISLQKQQLIITDKVTWWGCGSHIPSVMDSIPEGDWCACTPQVEKDGKKYPPKAAKAGWLQGCVIC